MRYVTIIIFKGRAGESNVENWDNRNRRIKSDYFKKEQSKFQNILI